MTTTTNIPAVERENGPSLHVKPCWPASLGHLMFHWVRLRIPTGLWVMFIIKPLRLKMKHHARKNN
jgi:hypothetical protein